MAGAREANALRPYGVGRFDVLPARFVLEVGGTPKRVPPYAHPSQISRCLEGEGLTGRVSRCCAIVVAVDAHFLEAGSMEG